MKAYSVWVSWGGLSFKRRFSTNSLEEARQVAHNWTAATRVARIYDDRTETILETHFPKGEN